MTDFHVGFSGTEKGMTDVQRNSLRSTLYRVCEGRVDDAGINAIFHHGVCIGADEEAHALAHRLGFYLEGHPGHLRDKTSDLIYRPDEFYFLHKRKNTLQRNNDIVHASHVMIFAPYEYREINRSGTWSTVRKARRLLRPSYIVFPDGTVKEENVNRTR